MMLKFQDASSELSILTGLVVDVLKRITLSDNLLSLKTSSTEFLSSVIRALPSSSAFSRTSSSDAEVFQSPAKITSYPAFSSKIENLFPVHSSTRNFSVKLSLPLVLPLLQKRPLQHTPKLLLRHLR